jgi:hypothetical protein
MAKTQEERIAELEDAVFELRRLADQWLDDPKYSGCGEVMHVWLPPEADEADDRDPKAIDPFPVVHPCGHPIEGYTGIYLEGWGRLGDNGEYEKYMLKTAFRGDIEPLTDTKAEAMELAREYQKLLRGDVKEQ